MLGLYGFEYIENISKHGCHLHYDANSIILQCLN